MFVLAVALKRRELWSCEPEVVSQVDEMDSDVGAEVELEANIGICSECWYLTWDRDFTLNAETEYVHLKLVKNVLNSIAFAPWLCSYL